MDLSAPAPGFVSSPALLPSAASPFTRAVTARPLLPSRAPRKPCRARFFALGAPPPSQPAEPEDEEEAAPEGEPAPAEGDPPAEVTADDILNSPAFLRKKLEIVQKELIDAKDALGEDSEAMQAEKDRYVRLAADFENFRRRSAEDLRKQDAKSTAKVCKEIVGVLDNFDRAIEAVTPETEREKVINNSYQSINKQLADALTKLNVTPIDAIGSVFDPEMHEAIQKIESEEHHEDVVCAQYQRGYKIEETLIRAAVVGVSQGPGPAVADGAEGNGAAEEGAEDGSEGVAEEGVANEVEAGGQ